MGACNGLQMAANGLRAMAAHDPMWQGKTGLVGGDFHLDQPKDWFEAECQRRIDVTTALLRDHLEEACNQRDAANAGQTAANEAVATLETAETVLKAEWQAEMDAKDKALEELADAHSSLRDKSTQVSSLQGQLSAAKSDADRYKARVEALEEEFLGDFSKGDADGDGKLDRVEWIAMFGDDEMFDDCDQDGSGFVEESEWAAVMSPEARLERLRQQQATAVEETAVKHNRVVNGFEATLQRDVARAEMAGESAVKLEKEKMAATVAAHAKTLRALNEDHKQATAGWEGAYNKMEAELSAALKSASEELAKWRSDFETVEGELKELQKWHSSEMKQQRARFNAQLEATEAEEAKVRDLSDRGALNELTIEQLRERNKGQSAAIESVAAVVVELIPCVEACLEDGYGPPADAERPTSWALGVEQVENIRKMDKFAKKVVGHAYALGDKVQAVVDAFEVARKCAM